MSTLEHFDKAFAIVVGVEGGYVVDQAGPTRFGVTEAVARKWGYQGDMKELPVESAKAIYSRNYWQKSGADQLQWPLALFVFDCAVNQGPGEAAILLQQASGVYVDGVIDPSTLAHANSTDQSYICSMFLALRAMNYAKDRDYGRDGKGWFRRLFEIALASC